MTSESPVRASTAVASDAAQARAGRAIVFESLSRWHYLLVAWYLRRGVAVYYKHLEEGCQPQRWAGNRAGGARIQPLEFDPPLYRWRNTSYDEAFDLVEHVYEQRVSLDPLVRYLCRLFASDALHLAFKKALVEQLSEWCYYRLLVTRVLERLRAFEHVSITLLPRQVHQYGLFERWVPQPSASQAGQPEWSIPIWCRLLGNVSSLGQRWSAIRIGLRVLGRCLVSRLHKSPTAAPQRFPLGVAIISKLRELSGGLRSSGFLAGEGIRHADMLLIPVHLPMSAQELGQLQERGLHVCDPVLPVPGRVGWQALRVVGRLLRAAVAAPPWLLAAASHVAREWVVWETFSTYYRVGKFVTFSDHGLSHIPRNILLQRQGTSVWYYMDSANMAEAMPPLEGASRPIRFDLWGYLYYDVMACWGERFIRYFRLHPQRVGRYVAIGCVWSEHIRLLREGRLRSSVAQRLQAHGFRPGQNILSVFPTWYHVNSITSPEDGLAFVRGIERLLGEFPDLFVIVKEKHPRWLFATRQDVRRQDCGGEAMAIYRAYEALEGRARCWFTGSTVDSSEIIAVSDLVISFPFTSATLEAIGAGVKGLYFDPRGRCRGGYYDRYPGVVAHSYEELRERVATLLSTPSGAYRAFLEAAVRGDTDPFLDGRGITRLRALLSGEQLTEKEPVGEGSAPDGVVPAGDLALRPEAVAS